MPVTETVTIINNSGKIISTGKQLFGLFKDAKLAYQEKKAALKPEPPVPGIKRAHTIDVVTRGPPGGVVGGAAAGVGAGAGYYHPHHPQRDHVYETETIYEYPQPPHHGHDRLQYDNRRHIEPVDGRDSRRRSLDDTASRTSSHRSHRSHRSSRTSRNEGAKPSRPPLTASNLRTLSEVSSTAPSTTTPKAYRAPYAETAMVSRPTLAHVQTMPVGEAAEYYAMAAQPPSVVAAPAAPAPALARAASESNLTVKKKKSIDMNLAYGSVPPDLESRTDLDKHMPKDQELEAKTLMSRIESVLVEAQCLQSSATAIISKLQGNPEAAAAVALTLAELSALLSKMSPAFLGVVQGGAPAIWALLASPQFLIAAGAAVGVTIVMFGGWKIIKRMKQPLAVPAAAAVPEEAAAGAMEMGAVPGPGSPAEHHHHHHQYDPYGPQYYGGPGYYQYGGGPGYYAQHGPEGGTVTGSMDEALVLEEELSTIETWRRGIAAYGDDESVDLELISPEAMRSTMGGGDNDDAMSRRTGRSHRSHRSRRHRGDGEDEVEVPERKSSSRAAAKDEESSESGRSSRRHHHSHHHHHRHHRHRDNGDEASESGSHRSSRQHHHHRERDEQSESGSQRSHRSSRSKRHEQPKAEVKAIEYNKEDEVTMESILRPKEKKTNMLKSLFKKKKDKEEEKERQAVSMAA